MRYTRLLERHMRYGRSEQAARDWMASTDEPNAGRIGCCVILKKSEFLPNPLQTVQIHPNGGWHFVRSRGKIHPSCCHS